MVADPGAFSQQPPPGLQAGLTVGLVYDGRTPSAELLECLRREGMQFAPAERIEDPDALVLDLVDADRRQVELLMREQNNAPCPAIAALSEEHLLASDLTIEANDFIVVPWQTGELTLRIQRLTERKKPADDPGIIRVGDLVINPSRYDVFLAGKPVLLTFKEYETPETARIHPGARLQQRGSAGTGVGLSVLRRYANGGCPHQALAQQDRERNAHLHRHRLERRVPLPRLTV